MKRDAGTICYLEPEISGGNIRRWWWRCAGRRAVMLPNASIAALAEAELVPGTAQLRVSRHILPTTRRLLQSEAMIDGAGLLTEEGEAVRAVFRLLAGHRGYSPTGTIARAA